MNKSLTLDEKFDKAMEYIALRKIQMLEIANAIGKKKSVTHEKLHGLRGNKFSADQKQLVIKYFQKCHKELESFI